MPEKSTLSWTSLFAQGEIRLAPRLEGTVGLRLEHNQYTGTETLPNARLAWRVTDEHLLWAAASRAVRAPAPLDKTIRFPPTPPYIIAGGPDFHSEVARVYELGWRGQPLRGFTLSVTGHYENWRGLRSGQVPPNAMVQNQINGHDSGMELWGSWQVTEAWRVTGGLTTLHKALRLDPGANDPGFQSNLGNDPREQWMLRASYTLARRHEFDVAVRHVAALPFPVVPAYTAVDLRYGWKVRPDVEVSFAVRNAFDPSHPEFEAAPGRSEIARSALLQVRWTR